MAPRLPCSPACGTKFVRGWRRLSGGWPPCRGLLPLGDDTTHTRKETKRQSIWRTVWSNSDGRTSLPVVVIPANNDLTTDNPHHMDNFRAICDPDVHVWTGKWGWWLLVGSGSGL
ncbi:hypothetical protein DIRU0_B10286 [Diutina rugosa]